MVLSNVLYCFIYPKANANGLQTHMVMEPFAVAAWRQLPSVHPVFKIIFPHLRTVMAVNNFIRHNLGNKQDVMQLLRKGYKSFKFSMLSLPEVLSKKGVDDATKLPKYFYR